MPERLNMIPLILKKNFLASIFCRCWHRAIHGSWETPGFGLQIRRYRHRAVCWESLSYSAKSSFPHKDTNSSTKQSTAQPHWGECWKAKHCKAKCRKLPLLCKMWKLLSFVWALKKMLPVIRKTLRINDRNAPVMPSANALFDKVSFINKFMVQT